MKKIILIASVAVLCFGVIYKSQAGNCDYPCLSCSSDGQFCTSCADGYGVGPGMCMTCSNLHNSNCLTCNSSTCTSCKDGLVPDGWTCKPENPDPNCKGYNSSGVCSGCNSGYENTPDGCKACTITSSQQCKTCSGDKCTSCEEGFTLKNGSCINCKAMYGDSCNTCDNGKCTKCEVGYGFHDNGTCQQLPTGCLSTTGRSLDICYKCDIQYKNLYGKCTPLSDPCPNGEVLKYDQYENKYACWDNNCSSYSTTHGTGFCDECMNGKTAKNGKCVDSCGEGYTILTTPSNRYVDKRPVSKCIPDDCYGNISTCVKCKNGFVQDGVCVTECDEGYIQGKNKFGYATCFPADLGCGYGEKQVGDECVAREDGEGCGAGFYLKDNLCVSESKGCGDGYLGKDGVCISSANGCGEGYKDMGGFCNRIQYTPAEAAPLLNDDDNFVVLTFKK